MQISDKVFVVTGGGNGMGREVVLGLIARGARVAAVDLSEDGLAETVRLAAAPEGRLTTHALSVSDRAAVLALPDAVIAAHGQVDGVFNIAGIIQPFVKLVDLDFDVIERVINVNFWGTVTMTKAFLPHLLARPAAGILNVSSMGGFLPVPGQAAYGASKAAVKLFTEALFAETQGTSVAVTVVFPGGVGTNITQNSGVAMPAAAAAMAAKAPKTVTPADAGRQIIEGFERGDFRVLIGSDARFMDRYARLSPKRATLFIAKQMKQLLS
ncbi:SDR family NAD(P)-dependent oxidoreductase [Schumannella luteola]|jgi:NAD(P)-dependent dehydrogenase (short-subunit alcohol dehydrogenase family)